VGKAQVRLCAAYEPGIVIASVSEAIQGRKKDWIASSLALLAMTAIGAWTE
jgi:hypothetical protein